MEEVGTKCEGSRAHNCKVRKVPEAKGRANEATQGVEEVPAVAEDSVDAGEEHATRFTLWTKRQKSGV